MTDIQRQDKCVCVRAPMTRKVNPVKHATYVGDEIG